MTSYLCPDCGVGAGAILTQNGPLPELCKQQLQNRRDSIVHGISVTRLAAFITEGCPSGEYRIQRLDEHTYEVAMPDGVFQSQTNALADRLRGTADHLDIQRFSDRLMVTDSRLTSNMSDREAAPDGGIAVDERTAGSPLPPVQVDDDPRTKRAKSEDMDVALARNSGVYEVHSESGNTYEVDVLEETCTCPDDVDRCKHQRRIDMEIQARTVPRPDGRLP